MNLVILGPQGSGKGTQAQLLVEKYGLYYFESGKILRRIASSDNQYSRVVKETTERGELVPDEYMRLIAWDFINKHDKNRGFLFDGYPRSVPQYEQVGDMLRKFGKKIDWVIYLDISEEESVKRLSARRECGTCGLIYNLLTAPPPRWGKCECGGTLLQREDDQPDAIRRRLELFKQRTLPVLGRAEEDGILMRVDGERPIGEIFEDIVRRLTV